MYWRCWKRARLRSNHEGGIEAMTQEEMAVRLTEVDARAKSNTHRIDNLEEQLEILRKLATSVEVMVKKMEYQEETINRIEADVNSIGQKVDTIEKKPAKRWDGMLEKIIWGIIGVIAAAIGSGIIYLLKVGA